LLIALAGRRAARGRPSGSRTSIDRPSNSSREPEQALGVRVDQHDRTAVVDGDHRHRRGLEQGVEQLLARLRRLGRLAGAEIGHEAQYERAFGRGDVAQADLDRKRAAVAMPRRQVATGAHRARVRLRPVAVAQRGVAGGGGRRHEHFDGAAEQFLARVAEQFGGASINQHDTAVALGGDDGQQGGLEQSGQLLATAR
jgi:hypothetical protein